MKRGLIAGTFLAAVVALAVLGHHRAPARPGPPPRVFAFLSSAGGAEINHLRRYGSRITVLAPNWYELDPFDGSLHGHPNAAVTALARKAGVQLWPVVNARLDPVAAIDSARARARMIGAIDAEAGMHRYQGMTLDIEQLPAAYSSAFDLLTQELARRLHAHHQGLAVYVPRRTADGGDRAYDWRALARSADLLIASGYNEHSATGSPGAVTTTGGFNRMLDYAEAISRTKIAPAIGAFGYRWPLHGGTGQLISTIAAGLLRARARARATVDGGDVAFGANGSIVHYPDAATLIACARDARNHAMRWLALFSIGREPNTFWSSITTSRQSSSM